MIPRQRKVLYLFTVFFLLFTFISLEELSARPYFEGKILKIIVANQPGGGYDRLARVLAKHLPKYIPGIRGLIVGNITGGGTVGAANYFYNSVKPDGLTIGALGKIIPTAQLWGAEGIRYDATKFSWICSAATEAMVLALRTDLPYKTFDDVLKAKGPIYIGSTGPAGTDYQFPYLMKTFMGANFNMVIFISAAPAMLAVERKEVDGKAGSYSSLKPLIERGVLRPLIRNNVSIPGIENLPVDENLTKDKTGKEIMRILSLQQRIARPYVAPPGTPPEAINIWRDAFAKVAKDPKLQEDAEKAMMEVDYISADECLKVCNQILSQPQDIVKEFKKYITF